MARWIFVRHGESEANRDGWYAGSVDTPLTAAGRQQAERLAERLAEETIAHAVCSDLQRARATAEIALRGRGVPLAVDAALRERSAGDWERRAIADVRATEDTDAMLRAWHGRPPGGESLSQVARRATRFLAGFPAHGTTLVVSHGALMRAVIGALDELPHDKIGRWHPGNCELVQREISNGHWHHVHARLEADPGAK